MEEPRAAGQAGVALKGGPEHHAADSTILTRRSYPMQVLPIDLTALVATILGISIVLVPVIGLTARYALKPLVEAIGRVFESRGAEEHMQILRSRLELQEQEIEALQHTVRSLAEARDFERRLAAPPPSDAEGGAAAPSR